MSSHCTATYYIYNTMPCLLIVFVTNVPNGFNIFRWFSTPCFLFLLALHPWVINQQPSRKQMPSSGSMATVDIGHLSSMGVLLGDPKNSIASYRFSYHAGDKISGSVFIRSEIDLRFDSLDIYFIGKSLLWNFFQSIYQEGHWSWSRRRIGITAERENCPSVS